MEKLQAVRKMRICVLLCFMILGSTVSANNPYRTYLLTKVSARVENKTNTHKSVQVITPATANCVIPRYEIPKGNVFCRMEDKLTRSTGLWLKIGVK